MRARFTNYMMTVVSGVLITFTSCTQDYSQLDLIDSLNLSAIDESQASTLSDGIINEVDNYLLTALKSNATTPEDSSSPNKSNSVFPVISINKADAGIYPRMVHIDFGSSGVIDSRNNILKGNVSVLVENSITEAGFKRTIFYDNLTINGHLVKGNKTITNLDAQRVSIVEKDTFLCSMGTSIVCTKNLTRTRISDNGTPNDPKDDVYAITGTSTGTNTRGEEYAMRTMDNTPMIIGAGWPYFTKGLIHMTYKTGVLTLDYGDGTKDNLAKAIAEGVVSDVTLKK